MLPRTVVTAGVRYQQDRQNRGGALGAPLASISLQFDRTFRAWLPKLSLAYDFSSGVRAGLMVQRAYNPAARRFASTSRGLTNSRRSGCGIMSCSCERGWGRRHSPLRRTSSITTCANAQRRRQSRSRVRPGFPSGSPTCSMPPRRAVMVRRPSWSGGASPRLVPFFAGVLRSADRRRGRIIRSSTGKDLPVRRISAPLRRSTGTRSAASAFGAGALPQRLFRRRGESTRHAVPPGDLVDCARRISAAPRDVLRLCAQSVRQIRLRRAGYR